jgi:hypothetical protein
MFAHNIGNSLIEAVNILGSLFYGVILGIFLVAFWIKYVKANAVFIAACYFRAIGDTRFLPGYCFFFMAECYRSFFRDFYKHAVAGFIIESATII